MPETGENPIVTQKNRETTSVFTEPQSQRWDADIRTIIALQTDHRFLGTPVVSGGIAVDILTGGAMRRPHQDIDFVVYTAGVSPQVLNADHSVREILTSEKTHWVGIPVDKDGKMELREAAEEKPWSQRRRLEFEFTDRMPDPTRVSRRVIKDSQGFSHEVFVQDLNYLVAKKIGIINSWSEKADAERAESKRPLNKQDLDDMRLLLAQPEFNQQLALNWLTSSIVKKQNPGIQKNDPQYAIKFAEAAKLAANQMHIALNINF